MRTLVALGALGCVALSAGSTPVAAQSDAQPPSPFPTTARLAGAPRASADTTGRRHFEIPAQPLADALADFARQAGVRVQADATALTGARSSAVTGTLTPGDALRALLQGTGLTARFPDARTAVVAQAGRDAAAGQPLRPVVITGAAGRRPGYGARQTTSATRTETPLRDTPQAVTVVTRELMDDQAMQGMADVVRYVPGVTMSLGEGHRDQPTIRGNSTTADFFVDGVRDDAQYLRDLYNVDRVEALKGPNAMTFGRGGGGGVVNRVLREAQWVPTRSLTLAGGSFAHRRGTLDVGQGVGPLAAARVTGMAERSGGFREAARVERYGVNPTLALAAGARTTVRLGYEYFRDDRRVDRGVPSFQGRPAVAARTTFFGNPAVNEAWANVHAVGATVEHQGTRGITVRNRTRAADYDKFYQNSYPGAVNAAGTQVALTAYNNTIRRRNLYNQTDLTGTLSTGAVRHTVLVGAEVGGSRTDQFRTTGYFADGTANGTTNGTTSLSVPLSAPTISTPVTFRQSATDADGRATTGTAAVYAQNQIALSPQWQAVLGLRYERFGIVYRNKRTGQELARTDRVWSPRAGLVFTPVTPLSVYGGYGVSYLPSAGDQFTALTATSQTLTPERFRNRELGVKWEAGPALALSGALYRLDRTNTAAPDPTDPARTVQTGAQRTTGYEVGVSGNVTRGWQIAGGYAWQRATLTSTTAAARAGATVPLVPRAAVSVWNRYQIARPLGLGLGVVHQTAMYAAVDNTVRLPGFTRVDAAAFVSLAPLVPRLGAQVNVENLFDRYYVGTAFSNNNLMPGAPRTVRVALTMGR
ncbi:TonB-dependent siderophore receptor [Roseisolibacter agri]|uniref:TonB-dependent receptor n=1 Tax=Roseisolibacter agri TaxID=2014610 RepID=A0AA37QEA9_9BACT|nr:TonB-dependent siderophore receptor [Roseisolibacter agri]GLC28231.1 TonB-dependent receptor [Roseisolibacter agri]